MENLLPLHGVPADRGFGSEESGCLYCATALNKGKSQLTALEGGNPRKNGNGWIIVVRVIGLVCHKYKILQDSCTSNIISKTNDGTVVRPSYTK